MPDSEKKRIPAISNPSIFGLVVEGTMALLVIFLLRSSGVDKVIVSSLFGFWLFQWKFRIVTGCGLTALSLLDGLSAEGFGVRLLLMVPILLMLLLFAIAPFAIHENILTAYLSCAGAVLGVLGSIYFWKNNFIV